MSTRFSRLHYNLETKYSLVNVVQPGRIDEIERERKYFCFCVTPPSDSTSTASYSRDRAHTLVEFPSAKFNDLYEVKRKRELGKTFRRLYKGIGRKLLEGESEREITIEKKRVRESHKHIVGMTLRRV